MSLSNPLHPAVPNIDDAPRPLYMATSLKLPNFLSWTTYLPFTQPTPFDPTPRYLIPTRSWGEALELLYVDLKADLGPLISWFLYRYAILMGVFALYRLALCEEKDSLFEMCHEKIGHLSFWRTTLFPFWWDVAALGIFSWLMEKVLWWRDLLWSGVGLLWRRG